LGATCHLHIRLRLTVVGPPAAKYARIIKELQSTVGAITEPESRRGIEIEIVGIIKILEVIPIKANLEILECHQHVGDSKGF
jgi:hypothetical protein